MSNISKKRLWLSPWVRWAAFGGFGAQGWRDQADILTDLSGCCRENWRKARSRKNRRLSQSRGAVTVTWTSVVRSGQILGIYFGGRTDRPCCWTRMSSQGRNNWNGEDLEVQFGGFRFGHVNTSEIFTRDLVKMFGRWPYLKLFTVLKL